MIETLEEVRKDAILRLSQAAADRRSAMHTPVVVTGDADARIMVLRAFDAEQWRLRFHTDSRAPKVAVLSHDPRIAVIAYDREENIQLRMRGRGWIEYGGTAVETAWEASTNFARRCYLGAGPGEPTPRATSGIPPQFEGIEPTADDLASARRNFAILLVDIEEIDWFCLAHSGHRRAILTRDDGRWVTP